MRSTLLATTISLGLVAGAHAGAIIKVSSDQQARVTVDGEDMGPAPMTISDLKAGKYEVKIENVKTGQVQTFAVRSPKIGTVTREIRAKWAPSEPLEQEAAAYPPLPPAPAAAPITVSPAPAIVAAPPVIDDEAAAKEAAAKATTRNRTRTRNVVLGAALANEIFVKGKSKDTLRKAAVAVGLLNEAANR